MKKYLYILMAMLIFMSVTSCDDGTELSTQQFQSVTSLNAFGPCPVARGGQLRFVGTNMNTVTAVVFPEGTEVTDIKVVSDQEIVVTVPQTAEVGIITLKTPSFELKTKSEITYLEPISLDSFSPGRVKAGDVLTIEGDYLNLMHGVILANDILVTEENFSEHTRAKISLIVPAEAQSGKIAITDAAEEPNIIESEATLDVVLPAPAKVENLVGKKPGDVVSIEGTDLDLICDLKVGDVSVDYIIADGKNLNFVLPETTPDEASVIAYPASGVEVLFATIGMVMPTELAATPNAKIWAGTQIVITGKDLDVVASVTFPGVVDAIVPEEISETTLTVTAPEGTQSGDLVLNCKSGATASIEIKTLKPSVRGISPNPAPANSEVGIKGTNMQIVAKVEFPGAPAVEVSSPDGKEIKVIVPTKAETGIVNLILTNGEVYSISKEFVVSKPECAWVIDESVLKTSDENEIHAGDIVMMEIENADKLIGVQIDGEDCQYILKDKNLYVLVPGSAGKKSVIKLISSNGEIEYDLSVIPKGETVTVLWSGAAELGWSGDGQVYVGEDGGQQLIDAEAKAGDMLRLKFAPTADDWAIQIWEGHWNQTIGMLCEIHPEDYDLAANGNCYFLEITPELLEAMTTQQWWGGLLVVQGQSMIITELALIQKGGGAETVVWEGRFDEPAWTNWEVGKGTHGDDNPNMFFDAGVEVGSKIRIYATNTDDWWQLQLFDGHWGGLTELGVVTGANNGNNLNPDVYDLSAGYVEIPVNQAIYELLQLTDWGIAFIIQCENLVITKITVE